MFKVSLALMFCMTLCWQSPISFGANEAAFSYDASGFTIHGQHRLIRGGSVQWFRLPEEVWLDRLKKFKAAGFNTVGMYIAWNQIEPEPGIFNFERPNLRRFLDMAHQLGLYVAVRPGPYITNEMDGGGLPAWLTKNSTKQNYENDGKVNLRSHDPDFIEAVSRYFHRLNQVLKPYQITHGGPIILYALENEYTWFERAFQIDKLFRLNGQPERPTSQELPTRPYFTKLRDLARESGIDIPLITCPGDGRVSAMGGVPGIIPMPSIYEWANPGQPDQIAYELLSSMHEDDQHQGIYQQMPAGSLELNRSAQEFRRLIQGGLDALFGFNMVGMMQEGYMNSLTLAARAFDVAPHWGPPDEAYDGWLHTIFKFDQIDRIINGFVTPDLGYFTNVIDYQGAISPSGVLRDNFYHFRRDNMTYDSLEGLLAPMVKPIRITPNGPREGAFNLTVKNPHIGSREEDGMTHYAFDHQSGFKLLQLVNQSGEEQVLEPGSINTNQLSIPIYTSLSIKPAEEHKQTYAHNLLINYPLSDSQTMLYATSELLTARSFNQDTLLVLYGPDGSQGEVSIKFDETLKRIKADDSFTIAAKTESQLTLTYHHRNLTTAMFETRQGRRLHLVVTNRDLAGRFWFVKKEGLDAILVGPDYVEQQGERISYSVGQRARPLYLLALSETPQTDPQFKIAMIPAPVRSELKSLPSLQQGFSRRDDHERTLTYNDFYWHHWKGQPQSLESLGIYTGHTWYRSSFELNSLEDDQLDRLYIESASDIVGIYINGHYLTTVNPVGTEIDNQSRDQRYRFEGLRPYLRIGMNVLSFRTEIWGHGSFMFGKGRLTASKARAPALSYDGQKGLYGEAKIGNHILVNWSVRSKLSGERQGFHLANSELRDWRPDKLPIALTKGEVRWFRTQFNREDIEQKHMGEAPVVLALKGRSSKATIYLNGRLIGRWNSDSDWLKQGSWFEAKRSMWVPLDADHFPIPLQILRPDQPNDLVIALEDTSHSDKPAGRLDSLSLEYNEEQFIWQDSALIRTSGALWRTNLP